MLSQPFSESYENDVHAQDRNQGDRVGEHLDYCVNHVYHSESIVGKNHHDAKSQEEHHSNGYQSPFDVRLFSVFVFSMPVEMENFREYDDAPSKNLSGYRSR